MDNEKQSGKPKRNSPSQNPAAEPTPNTEVDEFFRRLKHDMRWPKPSPEAMAAALQATQRLALEADSEESLNNTLAQMKISSSKLCSSCGHQNREQNRFCGACGAPMKTEQPQERMPEESTAETMNIKPQMPEAPQPNGQHHYHHHYHHHYFPAGSDLGQTRATAERPPVTESMNIERAGDDRQGKDRATTRAPGSNPMWSRGEATIRKITQEWLLACNNRQLDDLMDKYAADALLLRSNFPPVRGTPAIREFFFAALEAGLGDVEMDSLRLEIFGDIAYQAGRCRMLVPLAMGKRREERGKYLVVFARQSNAEWKIVADCWSSDLSLTLKAEPEAATTISLSGNLRQGTPRKTA